jgi:pyruvate formate lyase activating enzyme
MCTWIKTEVGKEIPVHLSRFYPLHKLKNLPPTPVETLVKARETAMKIGLQYVYIGNMPDNPGEHTYCPKDGKILIKRAGYQILENNIKQGKCKYCGTKIYGVWN